MIVRAHRDRGDTVRYGDAEDPEFLATLPLQHARWVVSTVRERDINIALLRGLRHHDYAGQVAVTAHTRHEAELLKEAGAHMVLLPFADAAKEAVDRLLASAGRPVS